MSSLLSMMLLTLLTATAHRSGTASNQPHRRRRPSWSRTRAPSPADACRSDRPARSETARADARRVRLEHADHLVDLERPDSPPWQAPPDALLLVT